MTERSIVIYHERLDVSLSGWPVDRMCREAASIMTLVRAAAPAISVLRTLDAVSVVSAANDRLALGVALVPKAQLPLPEGLSGTRTRQRKLQDLVLSDLAAIRASVIERQQRIDRLAARLRRAGEEIAQRVHDREAELVDLIRRAGGREVAIRLPDSMESLYLPALEPHRVDDHTVKLRARVSAIDDTEARLSTVQVSGGKPDRALPTSIALRPAQHAFRNEDRDLLASAWRSRAPMAFDVRLIRCSYTGKVVGARLVGIVGGVPSGSA